VKEDEIGRAFSPLAGEKSSYTVLMGIFQGKNHYQDLDIKGGNTTIGLRKIGWC
jgi:hypothetical protein